MPQAIQRALVPAEFRVRRFFNGYDLRKRWSCAFRFLWIKSQNLLVSYSDVWIQTHGTTGSAYECGIGIGIGFGIGFGFGYALKQELLHVYRLYVNRKSSIGIT